MKEKMKKGQNFDGDNGEEEKKVKTLVVIMMGAPGSGKSIFCDHVMGASSRDWVRICQDNINNAKSGTKVQCLSSAALASKENKSIFIERCNMDKEQCADFVKIGTPEVAVHAVVLDLPAKLCISRSMKCTGHEGNLQGGKAAAVVNIMLQKKELPKLSEGFSRITICQSESDVQEAVKTYSMLGPYDTLPSGCYGQKSLDPKKQVGIMKFLKKVDLPANMVSGSSDTQRSVSNQSTKETQVCKETPKPDLSEHAPMEVSSDTVSLSTTPTLGFPSISTEGFKFALRRLPISLF